MVWPPPTTVRWFRAHLTGRTQSVCINGALSDPEAILYGVPQGSILGPLMFIMYINDLTTVVKLCKVHLYADDTLLYFDSSSVQDIETSLSKDLENIVGWLNQNFLILNHSKTKIMLMGTSQKLNQMSSFTVTINNATLECVHKFRYLGVTLDPNLSWNENSDHPPN